MVNWKALAIVFMILALVEFGMMCWVFNVGINYIEKENECIVNVCGDYDSYYYDAVDSICECYEDGEIVNWKYLK